jgi:hypothetical protein
MVGCLKWIMTTRYDIKYAVGNYSRYVVAPQEAHLSVVKNMLRYLRGTLDYGVVFLRDNDTSLEIFANAKYGRDWNTRQSMERIMYEIGSVPVVASSKLQPTISCSTTEVEYRMTSDVTNNVKYLQRLMAELLVSTTELTIIWRDSQSNIEMVHNLVFHENTKHIKIHYHFVRELQAAGYIDARYFSSRINKLAY